MKIIVEGVNSYSYQNIYDSKYVLAGALLCASAGYLMKSPWDEDMPTDEFVKKLFPDEEKTLKTLKEIQGEMGDDASKKKVAGNN